MKFKLTVTTVKEFETDLTDYPEECKTPEDARVFEEAGANDDPILSSEGGDTTVSVELIEG
jgi:hypothetical protein